MANKTTKEIADAIRRDIVHTRKITLAEAAILIGKSPQTFSQMLKGDSKLQQKTVQVLSDTFGYSRNFLSNGEGELYPTVEEEIDSIVGSHEIIKPKDLTAREEFLWGMANQLSYLRTYVDNKFKLGVKYNFGLIPDLNDLKTEIRSAREQQYLLSILACVSLINQVISINPIIEALNGIDGD